MRALFLISIIIFFKFTCNSQQLVNGSFEMNDYEGTYDFWGSPIDYLTFAQEDLIDGFVPIYNDYLCVWQFIHLDYTGMNGQVFLPNGVPEGERCFFFLGTILSEWEVNDTVRVACGLELTSPLIEGAKYNLSFYKTKKDTVLQVEPMHAHHNACPFRIGVSSDSTSFGEEIYVVDTVADYGVFWEYEEFEFIAPFPAEYITIESINIEVDVDMLPWRAAGMVDHFQLNYVSDPLPDPHKPDFEPDHGTDAVNELDFVGLDIYPNPSNGRFTIKAHKSDVRHLELYTQLGKKITEFNLPKMVESVDLSYLSSGVYFLKGEGVKPERIVIQKD